MKLTVKALNNIGISLIVLSMVLAVVIFILQWFYSFKGYTLIIIGGLLFVIGQVFRALSKRKKAKESKGGKLEDSAQNWYNWFQ
jgi:cytochrome c biogenesis protein CcdA